MLLSLNLSWKRLTIGLFLDFGVGVRRSGFIFLILVVQRASLFFLILRLLNFWIPGVYSFCCLLRSVQDNFVWGLIGISGPNDDTLQVGLWEELENVLSLWDICWCLRGDFNVVKFPSERSTRGRLTFAMCEFSAFIHSGNLVDSTL